MRYTSRKIRTYQFQAKTDLWTGDIDGKPDRLISTGLLGSIRWWFEVLVRGLGGSACDPTKHLCKGERHCVACELFGCTGWARKFRFDVLQASDEAVQVDQIKQGTTFQLRFTPLRPVQEAEWILLDATLRLIAEHGALGAKTKVKRRGGSISGPSGRYGRVQLVSARPELAWGEDDLDAICRHVTSARFRRDRHAGFEWAAVDSLKGFLDDWDGRGDRTREVLRRLMPPTGETS